MIVDRQQFEEEQAVQEARENLESLTRPDVEDAAELLQIASDRHHS